MPHDATFPCLFGSYARSDGTAVAAELRQRLAEVSPWQDLVAMEGGQDWWHRIQHAIANAEYLVLVLTPVPSPPRSVRTSGATPAWSAPT